MTSKPTPAYVPLAIVGAVCLTGVVLFGMSTAREAEQQREDRIAQCSQVVLDTYAASDGEKIDLAADLAACERESQ